MCPKRALDGTISTTMNLIADIPGLKPEAGNGKEWRD
jgi:hypothetical protein